MQYLTHPLELVSKLEELRVQYRGPASAYIDRILKGAAEQVQISIKERF